MPSLISDLRSQSESVSMENSRRQSLLPSFLYSPTSSFSSLTPKTLAVPETTSVPNNNLIIPAPNEPGKIEMYSPQFYAACTFGGILSCGLTHMAVTPLDLVKCNMQVQIMFISFADLSISHTISTLLHMYIVAHLLDLNF